MQNTDTGSTAGYTARGTKLSTAQLLVATGFSCLKRHRITGEYYGVKKHLRKIKQVKLRTAAGEAVSERKLAEKLVRVWVDGLENERKTGSRTLNEQFAIFCRANGVPTLEELDEYDKRNKRKKGSNREPSIIPGNKKNIPWALRKIKASWKLDFNAPISTVKTSDVSAFLAAQTDLKAASFNELSRQIKNTFQLAVDDKVISTNPYTAIPAKQRRKRVSKELATIPTLEEFNSIVTAIRTQRFADHAQDSADLAAFLGLAALGEAEAQSLKWKDIDFGKGEMSIYRHKTKTYFSVPIYPRLRPFLEEMHERKGKPSGNEPVFAVACCKRTLESVCRRLNLPHFSPRSLRKMGITQFLRAGLNVKLVSKWQGHRDGGKLILDTYSDVISAADREHERAELEKLVA